MKANDFVMFTMFIYRCVDNQHHYHTTVLFFQYEYLNIDRSKQNHASYQLVKRFFFSQTKPNKFMV